MLTRPIGYSSSSLFVLAVLLVVAATTRTDAVHYPFTGPVFGLAIAPDGSLLATDAGAGIFEIRKDGFSQVAQLPGVTAVSPIGRGNMFAITSHDFGGEGKLYRVSRGSTREIADLLAFELRVNPDGNPVAAPPAPGPSNPFDVEALSGGHVLVADAAGNSLLIVDQKGDVDWIATLPNEVVSTDNAKAIFGCPGSNAPQCNLPAQLPAQGVATSVAVGPDGAYYMGELKGFPAPKGESRIWRIEPGARHAVCGTSPACRVVADGFTSVVDLEFGPNGTLYVVELDEESWLAMQNGKGTGGSLNACNSSTWVCTQIATGRPMLSAVAVGGDGTKFIVTNALIPATVDISALP
jgi:hypothetical protein